MIHGYWLRLVGTLAFWKRVIVRAGRHYGQLHSGMLAAAIAYYALVCLAPLALLTVVALQAWSGSAEAANDYLQQLIGAIFPEPGEILKLLGQGLRQPGARAILGGVVGLVALAWATLRLFEAVERGLTVIWAQRPRRHIAVRKLIAMATLVGVGVVGASFILTMTLSAWLRRMVEQTDAGSEFLARLPWPSGYTGTVTAFILSVLALFVAYKLLPEGWVSNRAAALAALSAAVLVQVAGRLFNFTIVGVVYLSMVYGTLTWVIIFLLWAYFGAVILLFGAHLGWAYDVQRAAYQTEPAAASSDSRPPGG